MWKLCRQAPTEHTNRRQTCKKLVCNVYVFRLSFHFCIPPLLVGREGEDPRTSLEKKDFPSTREHRQEGKIGSNSWTAMQHPSLQQQRCKPNQQRWHAKWKLSQNMFMLHTRFFFCMFGDDLHAQSALCNKISASKLGKKFSKSALLVGNVHLWLAQPGTQNSTCSELRGGGNTFFYIISFSRRAFQTFSLIFPSPRFPPFFLADWCPVETVHFFPLLLHPTNVASVNLVMGCFKGFFFSLF